MSRCTGEELAAVPPKKAAPAVSVSMPRAPATSRGCLFLPFLPTPPHSTPARCGCCCCWQRASVSVAPSHSPDNNSSNRARTCTSSSTSSTASFSHLLSLVVATFPRVVPKRRCFERLCIDMMCRRLDDMSSMDQSSSSSSSARVVSASDMLDDAQIPEFCHTLMLSITSSCCDDCGSPPELRCALFEGSFHPRTSKTASQSPVDASHSGCWKAPWNAADKGVAWSVCPSCNLPPSRRACLVAALRASVSPSKGAAPTRQATSKNS
mmetsp:Transcript_93938/g.239129  ORF Transcript_93938/g.239129 Transcript_93938/m.239129 type:complete len:266 (+) Transcript_93938:702-1499(+)